MEFSRIFLYNHTFLIFLIYSKYQLFFVDIAHIHIIQNMLCLIQAYELLYLLISSLDKIVRYHFLETLCFANQHTKVGELLADKDEYRKIRRFPAKGGLL